MPRYFPHNIQDRAQADRALISLAQLYLGDYLVADLPTNGLNLPAFAFATDGRKVGEGAAAGTGTPVYWDGVAWRRMGDDTTVAA